MKGELDADSFDVEGDRRCGRLHVPGSPRRMRGAGVCSETLLPLLPQGIAGGRSGGRGGEGGGEGQGVPRGVPGRREGEERGVRDLLVVPHEGRDREGERGHGSREWTLPREARPGGGGSSSASSAGGR